MSNPIRVDLTDGTTTWTVTVPNLDCLAQLFNGVSVVRDVALEDVWGQP
jgi:hypothetical protein